MSRSDVFQTGNAALVTGAADGIGRAIAEKLLAMGMRVCLVDQNKDALEAAAADMPGALALVADVADVAELQGVQQEVANTFGNLHVLVNNAGTAQAASNCWSDHDNWMTTLGTNLMGVINGIQTFVPPMLAHGQAGLVINTGSKQGITLPPGNAAYNVSKAGVKAVTESLQYDFRSTDNCQLNAHLLVPGFTYSGMIRQFLPEKPAGAWTTAQVADFMVQRIAEGDFYILCPDNETSREQDNKRMAWAMGDLTENRPALSRWDPAYEREFAEFMDA